MQQTYSIPQASKRLGLAPRTIRRYIQIGRLKHIIVVKHAMRNYHFLTEATIRAFLAEYERDTGTHRYYKRKRR